MAPIDVALTFTDALSGTWSFAITGVSHNESGSDDITGFTPGSSSLSATMRARREGTGTGRTYTLGYEGRDRAGNVSACGTSVFVPLTPTNQQ